MNDIAQSSALKPAGGRARSHLDPQRIGILVGEASERRVGGMSRTRTPTLDRVGCQGTPNADTRVTLDSVAAARRMCTLTAMATVEFEHITKRFDNGFVAVDDFSLSINDGELMVLVGPSGCGKSTALRILAGLEEPTAGDLLIDGRNVREVPPKDRDIAMVFQSYALYPHLSVYENIAFGLKLHHLPNDEIERRVAEASNLLGLDAVLESKPKMLSGGQRQRVAMGRAIVREPKVFLLDEPLSNLDAKLRVHMRSEILRLQKRLRTTTLYVTHDQVEAMTMGDRIAVMRDGKLLQVGTPKGIYNTPVDAFVAAFIGSPSMNLGEATLENAGDALRLCLGDQDLQLDRAVLADHPRLADLVTSGATFTVGIRPEDMEDATLVDSPAQRCLHATVELTEELGSETMVHFGVDAVPVSVEERQDLHTAGARGVPFVATFSPRTEVRPGETIAIAVDTKRLHFFDRETGKSI